MVAQKLNSKVTQKIFDEKRVPKYIQLIFLVFFAYF